MVSIAGEPKELALMATMLSNFDLVGIEINASCPNSGDDLLVNTEKVIASCEVVKSISRFPVILKISVAHDVKNIAAPTEKLVEAFSINSVPWQMVFPNQRSPLVRLGGGGVSGKIAQPFTWKLVEELSKITIVPIIGPSVWDYEDICKLRILGAKAISFGAIFLCYPWRPTLFVKKDGQRR